MVSLGGLGAAYGGYTQAGLDTQALNTAELDALGARALGKTFQAMLPGAAQGAQGVPAMGGQQYPPQPPQQPGQPSQPMVQPGQMSPPPMPGQAPMQAQGPNPLAQAQGQTPFQQATFSQESGNRDNVGTSWAGAQGPGQIMPKTFAQYAQPGENINNPAQNRAVATRIMQDYERRWPGDTARQAVAYYSGPGNVAPPGSPTPWKRDIQPPGHPRDPNVSQYVQQVQGRIRGQSPGGAMPQQGPPGQGGLPPPQGQFDLNTAAAAIARANPGIQPEVLVHALSKAMPYLNTQAQYQVRQAQMEMREAQLNQRDEALKQGQDKIMQQQQKMEDQRQQFIERQQLGEKKVEQGQQRIDIAKEKEAAKALDPAVAKFMASQLLTGQPPTSVLGGMARNAQAVQQVRAEFAKQAMEQGVSPQEIGRRMQEFGGQATAYKALGTAEARMANAAMSADVLIPVLEDASKKVSRTDFPDLNRIIQAAETKTGSPEVVAFGNAIQSVANTYAGVMSRGYQPSEASRKSAAMKLLNQYWSQGQLDAGIAIIRKEIAAEMSAPGKVRDYWAAQKRDQAQGQAPGAPGTPGGLQPDQTQLKPLTDALRTQAQGALKRGWTLDQIKQKMRDEGYDDSTIKAPTRDTTPGG